MPLSETYVPTPWRDYELGEPRTAITAAALQAAESRVAQFAKDLAANLRGERGGSYLAPGSTASDLNAMIAALSPAPSATVGHTIYLGRGEYALNARVVVPAWVNLQGAGKRTVTRFVCSTAGSGIDFQSRGGISGGFTIDGEGVATNPFRTNGVQRTFIDVDVRDAVTDGAIIRNAQNCRFLSLDVNDSGSSNLVLEEGAKNNLFLGGQLDAAGAYQIRTRQSLAQGVSDGMNDVVHDTHPNHNQFEHFIIERLSVSTGLAALYLTAGDISLNECDIANGVAVPQILMDWLGTATYCDLRMSNTRVSANGVASSIGIQTEGTSAKAYRIDVDGHSKLMNLATGWKLNDNTVANVSGNVEYTSVTTLYANNGGGTKVQNNAIRARLRHPLHVSTSGTADGGIYTQQVGGSGYGPSVRVDRFLVGNRTTFTETSIPAILSGSGTPESAVTAPIGSLYLRIDGGTDTAVYRKESGTGNTGWIAVTASAGSSAPWLLPPSVDRELILEPYPAPLATGTVTPSAGNTRFIRAYLASTATVANFHLRVSTAQATATNVFGGLYSLTGTLIAKTADQATDVQSTTGWKTWALTAEGGQSLSLTVGWYYLAFLQGSGTVVATNRLAADPSLYNANLAASDRFIVGASGSGLTALASSVTTTALTSNDAPYMALS